jgi:hypothetical protein
MEEELDTLSDLMNDVDEMASDIASAEDPDQAVNDLLAKAQEVSAQTGVVSALEPDLPEFEEADTAIEEAVATLDLSMAALQTGLEPGGTVEDINLSGELLDDATEMMAEARALFDDAG